MTTPDDDEFTELRDASIPRVDLVDKAANGTTFLIAKQAGDKSRGLMDPEFVRDLIKTAEPDTTAPAPQPDGETVTMTGSPAAIAKMIHAAAVRSRTAEDAEPVGKAEMSQAKQNDLPDSDFAYIEAGGHKDDEGKTTPRSLRHFPINDAAHVRNALARAPQSPFGDKAMPRIRAAAKKFGIEVSKMVGGEMDDGVDGLDPTVVLAEPEIDDAPGDENEPGSPAWEAIDAATAQKWTSIAVRLKNALAVMAERELLEAASADPDDAEAAWDLQDAQCALDYVIDTLAGFAVDEQAEAELGGEAMAAVGKALAGFDPAALDTVEALSQVTKAGRVLSAANEQAIRTAAEHLQKVLASLPSAPIEKESGLGVAKTANEEPNMPQSTPSEDVTEASGQEPAMGTGEVEKTTAPAPVENAAQAEAAAAPAEPAPVAKADGEKTPMVVVYDQKGRLIGICDPDDITPVANAEADADDMDDTPDDDGPSDTGDADSGATSDTSDLTPAPAAEAGTPADAATGDDGKVTKTNSNSNSDTTSGEVLKSNATDTDAATHDQSANREVIAKQAKALEDLAGVVETLKAQVKALEEQPAQPRVFTNGVQPPAEGLRGMDRSVFQTDVVKAQERRRELYGNANATEQNRLANEMQVEAIAALQAIQRQ